MKTVCKLFWLLLIGCFIGFGCAPKVKILATPEPQTDSFSAAERMFHGKSYQKSLSLYNEYLNRHPDGPHAPKSLMRIGEIYMNFYKDYPTARIQYKYLIERYPNSDLLWDAKVEIPATYYHDKSYKDAVQLSETLLADSPSKKHSARLNDILGDAYQATEQPEQAIMHYAAAHENSEQQDAAVIEEKIRASVQQLSKMQISSLLGTIQNNFTRGYLLFYMSQIFEKEDNPDAAQRVLSQLQTQYPDNIFSGDLSPSGGETSGMTSSVTSRTVGILLPLSGTYQSYGRKVLRGVEFAMLQFGNKNSAVSSIHLLIRDTESDDNTAAQRVRELADENSMVIIGPVSTAESAAMEAQRFGIPIIMLTQKEKITDIGDFVFRHFITPELQVKSLMNYLATIRGFSRFAVLYPDEPYGDNFMNLFWQESIGHNAQVVASESYSPNTTDFKDQIRRIKRSAEGIGVDALFLPEGVKKSAMIIPQLAFYDFKKVILAGTNLWHSQSLAKMVGSYIQGAVIPDVFFSRSADDTVRNFVSAFRETYNETPELLDAIAYDTAMMVFDVLSRPDIQSRNDVKNGLMQMSAYNGVTGLTSFGQSRDAQKQLHILEVQGSDFADTGRY